MWMAAQSLTASIALGAAVLMAAPGCGPPKTSDRDLAFVDVADAEELAQGRSKLLGLAGESSGVFVDPRTPEDFRKGHIPGAVNVPFQVITERHRNLKSFDVLIVYGDDYNDPKAEGMAKRLVELGHDDVRTLRGGLRAWTTAGNRLETGNAVVTP
jgi:3-mercaptopyruvate sulfurtransferase SseA